MGLFGFIKEAGEKLFGHKEVEQAASPEEKTRLNQVAAQAIFDRINSLGLKWSNLMVSYKSGQVTITGSTPRRRIRRTAKRSSSPPATCRASIMSTIN